MCCAPHLANEATETPKNSVEVNLQVLINSAPVPHFEVYSGSVAAWLSDYLLPLKFQRLFPDAAVAVGLSSKRGGGHRNKAEVILDNSGHGQGLWLSQSRRN